MPPTRSIFARRAKCGSPFSEKSQAARTDGKGIAEGANMLGGEAAHTLPAAVERAILLKGETFYAKRNFLALRVVDRSYTMRLHEPVFGRSARSCAHAAGGHLQLRAYRREGRAECCYGVHYPDGVADAGTVSIFR
jgi:hypothetical protein